MLQNPKLTNKLKRIRLLVFDVDGVLTNGGIIYDNQGNELKQFQVKDGQVMQILKEAGIALGAITGRNSAVVKHRLAELKIDVHLHGVSDKLPALQQMAKDFQLNAEQILYVGDDLPDLACIQWAGLGACPADAPIYIRQLADYSCEKKGGEGVIRELAELVLEAQGKWETILKGYQL